MKNKGSSPFIISSITEFNRLMGFPKPEHPLLCVVNLSEIKLLPDMPDGKMIYDFYSISMKRNVKHPIKYGRKYYDFSEGILSFSSPKQVFFTDKTADFAELEGWSLIFHPDLIRKYSLGKKIADYHFFSYGVNEALHLSDQEQKTIEELLFTIRQEYRQRIDGFSQDVIVSQIEVLLNYANRFYHRQFLTRGSCEDEILTRFEASLLSYFEQDTITRLPGVNELADKLNVSPHYLSDMLRSITGQNAQQHIHNFIIEKGKELLVTSGLSVSETAFKLGFEYPQYFSRLFKSKTGLTPVAFRAITNKN